jgi:hypothetical protein
MRHNAPYRLSFLVVLSGLLTVDVGAVAQECAPDPLTSVSIAGSQPTSMALSDAQYRDPTNVVDYGASRTYVIKGNCLRAFYNNTTDSGAAGAPVNGFNVNCFTQPVAGGMPVLVPLGDSGDLYLILAAGSYVYKIHALDGAIQGSFNTARSTCPQDTISAQPAVLIRAFAPNPALYASDIVFVSTSYSSACGSNWYFTNRIYGLDPATMQPSPQFNWSTGLSLGPGMGAVLDDDYQYLWYTFQRPVEQQASLIKVDPRTGQVLSAVDAGDVRVPPMMRSDKVYAADFAATLRVYDQSNLTLRLTTPLAVSTTLTKPFWVERRTEGGYTDLVLSVTQNGFVQATNVAPGVPGGPLVATRTWTEQAATGVQAANVPALVPYLGKAYIPGVNGHIYQVTASNGLPEANATIGSGTVSSPTFDFVGQGAVPYPNRISVSAQTPSTSEVKLLCLPWPAGSSSTGGRAAGGGDASPLDLGTPCSADTDCLDPQWNNECTYPACINGSCSAIAREDGTACTQICTGAGACVAGKCSFTSEDTTGGTCACNASTPIGGPGCAAGRACCGAAGCMDLLNDNNNCGNCGVRCGDYSFCDHGNCSAPPWRVDIMVDGARSCAGAILRNDWVVTNASCVSTDISLIKVRAGYAGYTTNNEQTVNVTEIDPYPAYDPYSGSPANDVAVVRLNPPLTYNAFVQPATIPQPSNPILNPGGTLWTSGFSQLGVLTGRTATIMSLSTARQLWGANYVPDGTLPASLSSNTGWIQRSDPAVIRSGNTVYLVGLAQIASQFNPALFTRIPYYLQWISSTTGITF